MLSRFRAALLMVTVCFFLCFLSSAQSDETFEIQRIGNIHPYGDNVFLIRSAESGMLTIQVHDSVCVYRTITEQISAGETRICWDGCGYNQEKLYEKTYTITALLESDAGNTHTVSFQSPIEYPLQCLQYALPSSADLYQDNLKEWFLEYRTVTDGTIRFEIRKEGGTDPVYAYSFSVQGGKIKRKNYTEIAGKSIPDTGIYTVSVYETSRPDQQFTFPLSVSDSSPQKSQVTTTGEIMPDRDMTDQEIWSFMMKPSVVVDIDFFDHQEVYEKPDSDSKSLGTLHGQTQGLKVIRIENAWAYVGAWNHEDASYIEGWVPYEKLKEETPADEYGILIDKEKQTMSVYRNGIKIDTLLVSTGRAEKKRLYQETSAGCFLTGYHRVNFSMNGKKYDYVIQYDGGNLLHQTPYNWGASKKDFTYGRGYLGAKASHACIRIQPEPGKGGLNAYWLFTHLPYHTRVIILDDPESREEMINRLTREEKQEEDVFLLKKEDALEKPAGEAVSISFGGRFTPGGTGSFNARNESFISFVSENGYSLPLSHLESIFGEDDFTSISLGSLLYGEESGKAKLKTSFAAPAEMLDLLSGASVDLIQMTSDSLWEAGSEAVTETEALLNNRISVLNRENVFTAEIKGHMFGFAGCSEKEYLMDPEVIDSRISRLKELSCEKIIFFASWGDDNAAGHSVVQEAMARRCVKAGADLVIGDHKGALQGIDYIGNVPVVYSLGSLLDGSTVSASKAKQGIVVRAVFSMEESGNPVSISVIPLLPCGRTKVDRNTYCPVSDLNYSEAVGQILQIWNDTADQIMDRIVFRYPAQK